MHIHVQYINIQPDSTAAYMKYCKPRKDGTCKLPLADYKDCRENFHLRSISYLITGVFVAFVYAILDERRAIPSTLADMYSFK